MFSRPSKDIKESFFFPTPSFDGTNYDLWKVKMRHYFVNLGREVCELVVIESTTTEQSKGYNTKDMKAIFGSLSDSV